jgi:phage terminase large subunit-like protein
MGIRKYAPSQRFFDLLGYRPYPYQADIHSSRAQHRVVVVGRQSGKSMLAAVEATFELLFNKTSWGWVVAPVYQQASIIFDRVTDMVYLADSKLPGTREIRVSRRNMTIEVRHYDQQGKFLGRSRFQGKTSENPDNLRGASLNYLIVDEAAMVDSQVIFESLMPTLTTTNGWTLFISTPKGYNWFYDMFQHALSYRHHEDYPYLTQYAAWQLPTWDANPTIPESFFEQQRLIMPERVFRQEYGAEFLADSGSVFQRLEECPKLKPLRGSSTELLLKHPVPYHRYIIGADFARLDDFSVFTVVDVDTREVVRVLRMNTVSWERQLEELAKLYREYPGAFVAVDARGVGDPLVEALASRGIPVSPIQLSTASIKEQLINKLALAIEHGRITLPDDYEYLQEFRDFVYERTAAGGLRMRAAGRGKDDRVLSLAIAWWFVPEEGVGHVLVPDNFAIELAEIQDTMGDEALEDMDALPV